MKQKTLAQIQEERRARRQVKALEADAAKNAEKSEYHQRINDEVRKRLSPSDEIAILRHAVVTLADVLIQNKVLKESDVAELLDWNSVTTEIKAKAKEELAKKGE